MHAFVYSPISSDPKNYFLFADSLRSSGSNKILLVLIYTQERVALEGNSFITDAKCWKNK